MSLLPHHLAHLRASGLSDDTIGRAGIYSAETPWVASQLVFPHLTHNLPAIAFPLLLPNRNGAPPDLNRSDYDLARPGNGKSEQTEKES